MKAYISSSKAISPQQTFEKEFPLKDIIPTRNRMKAIEPEYKQFINPMKLRRMSRVVKMGVATSLQCLKEAGIKEPEAIITCTGWGCLTDTFKFLDEIGEKQEQTLSPATFIQSTHNTVGGQIALLLGCQEYNNVYVNDSSSFEHGLFDALLLLAEGKDSVLIGGLDELNDTDFKLKDKAGWWKPEQDTHNLFKSTTKGTIAGEGSAFFLLNKNPIESSHSCITGINLFQNKGPELGLSELLSENNLLPHEIDLVISGINGDERTNRSYIDFMQTHLQSAQLCYYKHLTGEFDNASAFALWLADQIINTQMVPQYLKIDEVQNNKQSVNHILIHHFKQQREHAFILVSTAGV